ncbi:MAG: alpha/beta fold hydrolase [Fimbriimonas sp.]
MKPLSLLALFALAVSACAQSTEPLPRKPFFGVGMAVDVKGVKLTAVTPGTTAAEAGLKPDDIVVSIDGVPTPDPQSVGKAASQWKTGSKTKIEFIRGGSTQQAEATVRSRPADKGDNYETIYDEVKSKGNRIRIFVTKPTTPGKHPALFFIQGIGYVSNEQPLSGQSSYAKICKAFNDKGYVTVRVEKPGLGDSDGGPFDKVDWYTELDAFRQALIKTKTYDFVDPNKVVIFGHSMGGCQGPILASEIPIKGLAVYGTVIRTWHEYMVDMMRSQAALGGQDASALDEVARNTVAALHLIFNEGLSVADAKAKNPKWAAAIDALVPDGEHFSGIGMNFWRGCFAENYAKYWEKLDTNVLSIYGAADFVAEQIDHPMIAEVVNKKHPGRAKFITIPNSDHGFRNVASLKESLDTWRTPGKPFNPAIIDVLLAWADEAIAK